MEVYAFRAEDGAAAWLEEGGGRFEEEEGFLRADVVELFDVVASAVSVGGAGSVIVEVEWECGRGTYA